MFFAFLLILGPVNWLTYGPGNFLWISDITLFLAFLACVFESSFIASMAAIGGLVFETLWVIDLFVGLFFGHAFLTDYMFNSELPLWVRFVSLFHITLPFLLFWLIWRLGYDRRAWIYETFLIWVVLVATRLLTKPEENINLVFSYREISWLYSHPFLALFMQGLIVALVFALTHWLVLRVLKF